MIVLRIQTNIHGTAFSRKWLTAKSFIVDILPGSKYSSDERNIIATLKATTRFACALENYYSRKSEKFDSSPHNFM